MNTKAICSSAIVVSVSMLSMLLVLNGPAKAQETGEGIFKAKCAMCHGPDATGKTKMGEMLKVPDLHSAEVQKLGETGLLQVVTKGKQKMPAYQGKLSKEEIYKVVAYIRELGKKS